MRAKTCKQGESHDSIELALNNPNHTFQILERRDINNQPDQPEFLDYPLTDLGDIDFGPPPTLTPISLDVSDQQQTTV